jgi:hypothetical protein
MVRLPRYETRADKALIFQPEAYVHHKQEVDQLFDMFDDKDREGQFVFRGATSASQKLYTSSQRFWLGHELFKREESHVAFNARIIWEVRHAQSESINRYFPHIGLDP